MVKLATPTFLLRFEQLPRRVAITIVGGGLTGLQLAADLHREGIPDVLVVEAGSALSLEHVYLAYGSSRAEEMWLDPATDPSFWRPWQSECPPHFQGTAGLRRRLGGRSLYWHGVMLPIEDWALVEPWWPESMIHDLAVSWRGGPSLYARAAQETIAWRDDRFLAERGMSYYMPCEFLQALGYQDAVVTPAMLRHYEMPSGEVRVAAYSPVELWRDSTEADRLPLIVCDTQALGILVRDGRAHGIRLRDRFTGQVSDIECDLAFLAAGTVENTRLALQAGAVAGEGVASAPRLMDHLVQGFIAQVPVHDLPIHIVAAVRAGPLWMIRGSPTSRTNTFVSLRVENSTSLVIDAWCMGEHMPNEDSYVRCTTGAAWPWPITIYPALSTADQEVLSAQRQDLNTLWARTCALAGRATPELAPIDFVHPERTLPTALLRLRLEDLGYYRPLTWSSPLGTVEHEGGTLSYGRVLDDDNQFKRVRNLFAVGSCTLPRLGTPSPGMTTLSLIRRLAAIIAAQ